jgi:hypothetical protein
MKKVLSIVGALVIIVVGIVAVGLVMSAKMNRQGDVKENLDEAAEAKSLKKALALLETMNSVKTMTAEEKSEYKGSYTDTFSDGSKDTQNDDSVSTYAYAYDSQKSKDNVVFTNPSDDSESDMSLEEFKNDLMYNMDRTADSYASQKKYTSSDVEKNGKKYTRIQMTGEDFSKGFCSYQVEVNNDVDLGDGAEQKNAKCQADNNAMVVFYVDQANNVVDVMEFTFPKVTINVDIYQDGTADGTRVYEYSEAKITTTLKWTK